MQSYKKQIENVITSAIYDDKYDYAKNGKNVSEEEWTKIKYAINDDKAKHEELFPRVEEALLIGDTGETDVYFEYYSFHETNKNGKYNNKKCDNGATGNMKIKYKRVGDKIRILFNDKDFY